jgi:biopolymer transport protein ExbB
LHITQKFLAFALLGAEWVLWILIALSIVSLAIMIERALFFSRNRCDVVSLGAQLKKLLGERAFGKARDLLKGQSNIEAIVVHSGLAEVDRGADAVAEAMLAAKARERLRLERNLAVLGTLGNNSPFIGLFGTVLGIIKASHDLTAQQAGGGAAAAAVMSGVFEALVATAVGLLVAIPAVMAFNYFQRRVKATVSGVDSLAHTVLAELRGETPAAQAATATAAAGSSAKPGLSEVK